MFEESDCNANKKRLFCFIIIVIFSVLWIHVLSIIKLLIYMQVDFINNQSQLVYQ